MPVRLYRDLPTDSLSAITSALSKFDDSEAGIIQILIRPAQSKWKKKGKAMFPVQKRMKPIRKKPPLRPTQKF